MRDITLGDLHARLLARPLENQQPRALQEIHRPSAEIMARGGRFKVLEGPEKFQRFVVIEFPTLEQAVACHDSPEYQAASAWRKKDGAGEVELVILESGEFTK
jgi:uncharacterized protein (DUF1330 family)